eukprot:12381248-Ditylum_brightwellii.AAC.1
MSSKMSATAAKKHHRSASGGRGGRGGRNISFGRGRGRGYSKTSSSTSRVGPPHEPSPPKFGLQKEDVVKKNSCDIQNDLVEAHLKQLFASPFPSCFIKPVTTFL